MLVFMCEDPKAEERGCGDFVPRDSSGVVGPCLRWDTAGHVDEADLKYLQGFLHSPFSEPPLSLAQFMPV